MIAAGEPLARLVTQLGWRRLRQRPRRGLLTDLTPLIERDKLDFSVFIPEVLKIYQNEGKTYGLPFLTTGSYVFYNIGSLRRRRRSLSDHRLGGQELDVGRHGGHSQKAHPELRRSPTSAQYGLVENRQNIEGPAMVFGQFPWPEDAYATGFADKITLATPENHRRLPEAP